ncbi:hypothetical protein ACSFBF_12740 [Variovorax sp. ZT5P49]|uniref:hypothetical protein n=1 Tax=Variovorax sp. ZT5P49 TaxID=3443733 RepID=UPI003F47429E
MNVGFEKITPTPAYPDGTSAAALHGLPWSSGTNVVTLFKTELKPVLRKAQRGRCCFCRRLLYHDYATHLEHFVDKGGYEDYTFEIQNLALACGTCNIKKNGHFSTWTKRFNDLSAKTGYPVTARCPVLAVQLNKGAPFPTSPADFRWVNPHLHKYSDHIEVRRGWVFYGKTREGTRTIRGVKLNEVGEVEQRALSERLETRGGRLSMLVGALAELHEQRARDVAKAVVLVIKRRRQAAAASAG